MSDKCTMKVTVDQSKLKFKPAGDVGRQYYFAMKVLTH